MSRTTLTGPRPAGLLPCRCLFCGEVVLYDLELSANLNNATGCSRSPHRLHACVDVVDPSEVSP